MQRWLVGAGVVVLALVGAVLFIPRPDTGERVEEHVREKVPVETLRKANPVELQKSREGVEEKRAQLREMRRPAVGGTLRGGAVMTTSTRYRNKLAELGFEQRKVWEPWERLDKALDATGSKEGIEFREKLVELEQYTHASFEDPRKLRDLPKLQQKILMGLEKSPVSKDRGVSEVLVDLRQQQKQFARDVIKL